MPVDDLDGDGPEDNTVPELDAEHVRKDVTRWLEALENPTKALNAWEEDFLESVSDDFTRYGRLTQNQMDKLEEIYDRKA